VAATFPPLPETPNPTGRGENLALVFQEFLTVIIRLRAGRQDVPDAQVFRAQVLAAVKSADQHARSRGYTEDNIRLAVFAVVAFLDESILNLRQPVFKDWVRQPLQEELFGRHVAGEVFFENLQQILGRRDARETADLLEVYYLCLLLGYLGRYSIAAKGDLRALMNQVEDKIHRIRKMSGEMSPAWRIPAGTGSFLRLDPWLRRLMLVLIAVFGSALILFVSYKISLSWGADTLGTMAPRAASVVRTPARNA
jgi:type VI secretion system protein ImpK